LRKGVSSTSELSAIPKRDRKVSDDVTTLTTNEEFSKFNDQKNVKKDENSVKCIYGKKGLLQFMYNMFSLLKE